MLEAIGMFYSGSVNGKNEYEHHITVGRLDESLPATQYF